MRILLALSVLLLCACPPPEAPPDAGEPVDAGVPTPCATPDGCRELDAVCREGFCETDVPCSDDLECGLGERCLRGQCRFRGCVADAECTTGACDERSFSCAECGADAHCPKEKPRCDLAIAQCVACRSDADCGQPGPGHCASSGQCVACLEDAHCPNGLSCSAGNVCVGVPENQPCPEGTACGPGLACVTLNGNNVCLKSCALYQPQCPTGQICFTLTYATTTSLVFESMGPIGVCFGPQNGLRGVREPCTRTPTGSNCQPNLQCIPETATLSLCRAYCNPLASGTCPAGEKCTPFVGDYSGREYGLCMADTGFGVPCEADGTCRAALSCQPWDVPSESDLVGGVCQFNVGDGGAMAPCGPRALVDGGVVPADRACRSGRCVKDPLAPSATTAPYFCFGACATNADCGDAGICDADFSLTTLSDSFGYERGCRPRCEEEADCAGYDAGVTCRVRVVATPSSPSFASTCSPTNGVLPAGAPCTVNGQCRSSYCLLDDSRGVRHQGVCATPCRDGATCESDGGVTLPLGCQATAVLVSRGFDSVANTADDRLAAPRLCSGVACLDDPACRPDGGTAICGLEVDPSLSEGALVQRCRPPTAGLLRGGEVCVSDLDCRSGACGTLQPPSTGSGRACFEACTPATTCAANMTCRVGALQVTTRGQGVLVDSCAP